MRKLCFLAAMLPMVAVAQDDALTVSGSVRARYEALSGQPRLAYKPADQWLSFRSLIDAQYDSGAWRFAAELQDSRVYLADTRSAISSNDVNAVELAQAYVSTVFDAPVAGGAQTTLQAGRFTMNLGARRLVAADDYRNTTSSVTGLRVDSKTKAGWSATAFYTLPVTRLPESAASLLDNDIKADRESSAAVLYGALVQTPRRIAGGALEAMLLQFRERDAPGRPTRDRDLTTLDLRLFREPAAGHWDWEAEVALQTGSAHTSTAATAPLKDVAADFVHLRAGYQWASAWKPRLAVEYDRASGEGSGAKSHRFDTLFGMRRADFAPSGLYALVGRANISSPGLRFEATPSARLDVMATARALFLASAVDAFSTIGIKDPKGLAGDHAGTQFDTRLRYWLVPKRLRLDVGAILLGKGRFLLDAPGTRKDGDVKFLNVALQANF